MGRKGMSTPMQIGVGAVLLLLVGGGLFGAYSYVNQGTGVGDGQNTDQTPKQTPKDTTGASWAGIPIKVNLHATNLSGDTVKSGQIHIWKEKPKGWGDDQAIQQVYSNDYKTLSVDSDGVTTFQDMPGTYYVAVDVSGDYPQMMTVTIPNGEGRFGKVYKNPGEYNQNPKQVDFTMHDRYSLGSKNIDLGISTNTTENKDYSSSVTYDISENHEYRMDYLVVQTGSVDPTKDSNTDGVYDEGLTKSYIEVSGAKNMDGASKTVFFNPSLGVDKLGSTNKAKIQVGTSNSNYLVFNNNNKPSVEAGVTATESGDGTSASSGDEVASNGENFWDYNFFDSAGNSNTVADITG